MEACRKYIYSKFPVTSLRVVSYSQPRVLGQEVEGETKDHKSRMGKLSSKSCPGSPALGTSSPFSRSAPASPRRSTGFPSTLLVEKAIEKLGKKSSGKKEMKEKKRRMISDKLESGMTRQEVLQDVILLDNGKKNSKKAKKLKHLIRDCDQQKKVRREMRIAEFQEKRGFRRHQQTEIKSNKIAPFLMEAQTQSRRAKREEKISRAAIIPSGIEAAWKFLKKETQKVTSSSSDMGRKLKKDLKQEIFGLKNGLHSAPLLKKVERKRLADMVINLRNHA